MKNKICNDFETQRQSCPERIKTPNKYKPTNLNKLDLFPPDYGFSPLSC